ncbi:cell division protein [Bifidobacterium leontopitheci]|uniref:Cell division protein n=2 Tax=Bifidobacterium leontopitheci TaxID=2650774 RepID=A0A6I1GQ86_9BIFI|nr:cell division protein [Bifidobacterium leontopitheci]
MNGDMDSAADGTGSAGTGPIATGEVRAAGETVASTGTSQRPVTTDGSVGQSTDAYSMTYADAQRLEGAPSVWSGASKPASRAAKASATRTDTAKSDADAADYARPPKPTFPINQLPDLRETLNPDPAISPEEAKSRDEFTTVYDIIDAMEETLQAAKTSIFAPSMVRVDRDEFTGQLDELKKMLPVQLERASALMREAERRLESAQTQANAIVASAQSRAADLVQEANKQAQILVGQENITDKARQRARAILDKAQARADHLTNGADEYCTTVMTGLQEQLDKLGNDVQAGLNVLQERQRAAAERMPHLEQSDYPDEQ